MFKIAASILALTLAGCATNAEYLAYSEARKAEELSKTARYIALAEIGKSGDATAKVAAAMALAAEGSGQGSRSSTQAPISSQEMFLRWAGVLVPGLTQAYAVNQNARVAITQSNNSAEVSKSTNQTMQGIAGLIQAPGTTYNNSYNNDSTHPAQVVNPVVVNPVVVDPVVVDPVVVAPSVPQ